MSINKDLLYITYLLFIERLLLASTSTSTSPIQLSPIHTPALEALASLKLRLKTKKSVLVLQTLTVLLYTRTLYTLPYQQY